MKFVLTFAKSDQTLVETCTVALYFGSDICQIKLGFVQVNPQKMSDVQLYSYSVYTLWVIVTSEVLFYFRADIPNV